MTAPVGALVGCRYMVGTHSQELPNGVTISGWVAEEVWVVGAEQAALAGAAAAAAGPGGGGGSGSMGGEPAAAVILSSEEKEAAVNAAIELIDVGTRYITSMYYAFNALDQGSRTDGEKLVALLSMLVTAANDLAVNSVMRCILVGRGLSRKSDGRRFLVPLAGHRTDLRLDSRAYVQVIGTAFSLHLRWLVPLAPGLQVLLTVHNPSSSLFASQEEGKTVGKKLKSLRRWLADHNVPRDTKPKMIKYFLNLWSRCVHAV